MGSHLVSHRKPTNTLLSNFNLFYGTTDSLEYVSKEHSNLADIQANSKASAFNSSRLRKKQRLQSARLSNIMKKPSDT